MGRVRTKTTKRAARVLIEKYYPKLNANDFHTNKRVLDEVAIVPSKRLRNKIAGFTTHLMKRIAKGPVRGISFKLQEEERERKVCGPTPLCRAHASAYAPAHFFRPGHSTDTDLRRTNTFLRSLRSTRRPTAASRLTRTPRPCWVKSDLPRFPSPSVRPSPRRNPSGGDATFPVLAGAEPLCCIAALRYESANCHYACMTSVAAAHEYRIQFSVVAWNE